MVPALLLFCLWPMAGAAATDQVRLEVISEQDEALVSISMPEGERWCLGWNHSVAHFRVLDCYRHVAGEMWLERSHQPDFAAGLGHTEGRGQQVSDGHGGYWIENIHEPVPANRYVLRVGSTMVNHRLLWHDGDRERRVSLSDMAAGERVTLQLSIMSQ